MKIILLALIVLNAEAKKAPISLDSADTERTFAGLGNREPMGDSEWLDKVGDKKLESYSVKKGENLWSISRKVLGDPFLWRKLWEVNAFITNPHEIEPGTVLKYYDSDRKPASQPEINVSVVKLRPTFVDGKSTVADLDKGSIIAANVKNRFRPSAFVLAPEDTVYGQVKGSHRGAENLYIHESLYVEDFKGDIQVGDEFALVREERDLRDKNSVGVPNIGTVVRMVGEIKITELGEKLKRAELTSVFGMVQRGDKLVNLQKAVEWSIYQDPPKEMQARIVSGEEANMRHFAQGQLVLLNKGSSEGMKRGFVFRVWADSDNFNQNVKDVEPESKGEVRVIQVSALSSVGFIMKNTSPLEVGDWLIPRQAFKNPPNPPTTDAQHFEF